MEEWWEKQVTQLEERIERAIELQKQGRQAEARTAFDEILAEAPDHPDALHFSGIAHYQAGEHDTALQLIRRSLELAPGQPGAWTNAGNILRTMDKNQEAYECWIEALRQDPGHADAWCNIGVLMHWLDRLDEAVEALTNAIKIQPGHGEALHNLGICEYARGNRMEAADAFRRAYENPASGNWASPEWYARLLCACNDREKAETILLTHLEKKPGDPTLLHQLTAVRGMATDRAPDDYVREHFDRFAESFDFVLNRLDYRAPQLVADKVRQFAKGVARIPEVVDLGCGTGLCGPLIRDLCGRLAGVDLSAGMLRKAARRECYDLLVEAELVMFLTEGPKATFDLAISVDTLCYFGALDDVFTGLRRSLKRGGLFVGTVESADGEGVQIDESGRYQHSEAHLRAATAAAGLRLVALDPVVLRMELGRKVQGFVFALING